MIVLNNQYRELFCICIRHTDRLTIQNSRRILADIPLCDHKLLRLGTRFENMMLSVKNPITRILPVLVMLLALTACQSGSPGKHNRNAQANKAFTLAEALFASEKAFSRAMQNNDPLAMIEAALERDNIMKSGYHSAGERAVVAARTDREIALALAMAERDAQLLEKAQEMLAGRESRNGPRLLNGGSLFGDPASRDEYVQKLVIQPHSDYSMRPPSRRDAGAIAYVEHAEHLPIVLTVTDSKGSVLCKQVNPKGYLLCRWQAMQDSLVTVRVSNQGSQPATVLLIRN